MSLSVGIVGLPNVGKSTLFNALLKKQQAFAANFPFATIEPNTGVVPVPNDKLLPLAEMVMNSENLESMPPIVPATVEFLDIAGLVEGAHKGEGLGNKFLSHIREVNAICHVLRAFKNENIVREGSVNPKSDFEIIETELMMADLQTLEKQKAPKGASTREEKQMWSAVEKLKDSIKKGIAARYVDLTDEEKKQAVQLSLLTAKPVLVAVNVDDEDLQNSEELEAKYSSQIGLNKDQVILISAQTEVELGKLSPDEQIEYLQSLGVEKSGLERLIKRAFAVLDLTTFLTAGEKEVRAWTINKGISAQQAAGVIHTDFSDKFIKAEVIGVEELLAIGSRRMAKEKGQLRLEGKDYVMKECDVVEFKVGA